jgi:hypothetical protein
MFSHAVEAVEEQHMWLEEKGEGKKEKVKRQR